MNRPISLREILQAKIVSLEETAGQLKGLSELKQSVAEDEEYPPHNAEGLREKVASISATPLVCWWPRALWKSSSAQERRNSRLT
jgi:hypothetical protein